MHERMTVKVTSTCESEILTPVAYDTWLSNRRLELLMDIGMSYAEILVDNKGDLEIFENAADLRKAVVRKTEELVFEDLCRNGLHPRLKARQKEQKIVRDLVRNGLHPRLKARQKEQKIVRDLVRDVFSRANTRAELRDLVKILNEEAPQEKNCRFILKFD